MNAMLSAEHQELLNRVLTGDVSPEDPRVQAAVQASRAFRSELAELRRVSELLDAAARDERETLDSIDWERQDVPGADVVAPFLRARARELHHRRRFLRRSLAAAAAAALVAGGYLVRALLSERQGPSQGEITLGSGGLELLGARAPDGGFGSFRWRYDLPPGGWYEIRVWGVGEQGERTKLAGETHLTAPQWSAPPEAVANWPDTVHWEVRAYGPTGGTLLAQNAADARRSSP